MTSDIRDYARSCETCQKSKVTRHTRQPILITSIPLTCFDTIYMDHVGKISPPVNGNSYILTIICDLSKFAIAIPVPDNGAETTARNLVEGVFLKYGFPSRIVTDNHKCFTGETLKQITKILQINQAFTSPYTPSSNAVERFHRTLGNYLRAFVHKNPNKWCDIINYALWAYNNTVHTSTNYTPFELVFGRNMTLPNSIARSTPSYTYENYLDELKSNLRGSWNLAKESLLRRKEKNQQAYNDKGHTTQLDLSIGDSVFIRRQVKGHKFEENYDGPFKVIQVTGPNSVKLRGKNNKIIRSHKDKLKKLQN